MCFQLQAVWQISTTLIVAIGNEIPQILLRLLDLRKITKYYCFIQSSAINFKLRCAVELLVIFVFIYLSIYSIIYLLIYLLVD